MIGNNFFSIRLIITYKHGLKHSLTKHLMLNNSVLILANSISKIIKLLTILIKLKKNNNLIILSIKLPKENNPKIIRGKLLTGILKGNKLRNLVKKEKWIKMIKLLMHKAFGKYKLKLLRKTQIFYYFIEIYMYS